MKNKKLNIEIDVHSKKDLVSKYSDDTLSLELKEYLLNELVGEDINSKVNINFNLQIKLNIVEFMFHVEHKKTHVPRET